MLPTFRFVTENVWGRDRDGSLWLDVPAQMRRCGCPSTDRQARQVFARRAIRDIRGLGITDRLIVAWVDGLGAHMRVEAAR